MLSVAILRLLADAERCNLFYPWLERGRKVSSVMELQQTSGDSVQLADSDPVIRTLQSLLQQSGQTPGTTRFAEAVKLAMGARAEMIQSVRPVTRASMAPYRLRRAQQYLEEHLCAEVRLEQIAAAAGLSTFHFCRQFKKATGSTPLRYVLERRVERAKRLVVETDKTLVEIALELGFSGQSHFTAIFRKLTGQTPRRYREAHRQ